MQACKKKNSCSTGSSAASTTRLHRKIVQLKVAVGNPEASTKN
jgi:hypothetical protein